MKSNIARVILAITFLFFISELSAQRKDSLVKGHHLSEVEIIAPFDAHRYLWKLLKENYSVKIHDTTIFYAIDYKVEIRDSNQFEQFTGVVCVEYKDNERTAFVCEGSYTDSNNINIIDFVPLNFNIGSLYGKSYVEKYRKFKKHKVEYNKMLCSFSVVENIKKGSFISVYKLNNRLLSSYESVSSRSVKRLFYAFNDFNLKIDYDSLLIPKDINLIFEYSFKEVNAIMSISLESIKNTNYTKKQKIDIVTPECLYDYLFEED